MRTTPSNQAAARPACQSTLRSLPPLRVAEPLLKVKPTDRPFGMKHTSYAKSNTCTQKTLFASKQKIQQKQPAGQATKSISCYFRPVDGENEKLLAKLAPFLLAQSGTA